MLRRLLSAIRLKAELRARAHPGPKARHSSAQARASPRAPAWVIPQTTLSSPERAPPVPFLRTIDHAPFTIPAARQPRAAAPLARGRKLSLPMKPKMTALIINGLCRFGFRGQKHERWFGGSLSRAGEGWGEGGRSSHTKPKTDVNFPGQEHDQFNRLGRSPPQAGGMCCVFPRSKPGPRDGPLPARVRG